MRLRFSLVVCGAALLLVSLDAQRLRPRIATIPGGVPPDVGIIIESPVTALDNGVTVSWPTSTAILGLNGHAWGAEPIEISYTWTGCVTNFGAGFTSTPRVPWVI
jgi:hypothetical protein